MNMNAFTPDELIRFTEYSDDNATRVLTQHLVNCLDEIEEWHGLDDDHDPGNVAEHITDLESWKNEIEPIMDRFDCTGSEELNSALQKGSEYADAAASIGAESPDELRDRLIELTELHNLLNELDIADMDDLRARLESTA